MSEKCPPQHNRATGSPHCRGQAFRLVPFPWCPPHMPSPTCQAYGERNSPDLYHVFPHLCRPIRINWACSASYSSHRAWLDVYCLIVPCTAPVWKHQHSLRFPIHLFRFFFVDRLHFVEKNGLHLNIQLIFNSTEFVDKSPFHQRGTSLNLGRTFMQYTVRNHAKLSRLTEPLRFPPLHMVYLRSVYVIQFYFSFTEINFSSHLENYWRDSHESCQTL